MENNANAPPAPPVIYMQSQQHHHAPQQQQQHDHHRQPQISSQHDGIQQQEQPYMLPGVAHADITRSRSPYTAAPPQQHHAPLTMSSQPQTSSHHVIKHQHQQQQQQYMMSAPPPPTSRQQQHTQLTMRPQSPYSDLPPQHQNSPSTMRSQPPYAFLHHHGTVSLAAASSHVPHQQIPLVVQSAPMMTTTQQLQLQERPSSTPPIHYDEPSMPASFYQHGDLLFHHSDPPPELFLQQGHGGRSRNTADVASSQSMPLAPHGNSYDGYSRASGQQQHGGSYREHQGYHQNMNEQVDRQNSNHQYSPANMSDVRYPQHVDDRRQLHQHLPETTPDVQHPDTRHYHHGGSDQRHQLLVSSNPSTQNTVITPTRSARSEPPPRTPQQHQRHHRESETHYNQNGQSHNHLRETAPDYHPDTRYYYHGGSSAQLYHPMVVTNNYNQDAVIAPTTSASSEPLPRTTLQQPHHHIIYKSESETNHGQYGTQSSYKYRNNSQYENRNHDYPSHPNDQYTWDALCCDGRRDIDNYGYEMPQRYDNRPNNNVGSRTTPMPGFYVDSRKKYEEKKQQQHRKQQIYREHEYRDPPPTTSINPGYYNTGPISPLSVSIPSFADRPVENHYVDSGKRSPQDSEAVLLGSSGENSPTGEMDGGNDLKGQYGYHPNSSKSYHRDIHHGNNGHSNGRHPRYGDNNDAFIHAVPRQVVYPTAEHASKDRHYYDYNAAAPPPPPPPRFDRRDDSSGSSTISPSTFTPVPHRQQGHFPPPTQHEYSSRNDHESRREPYSAEHYRDDPSRLRIEIPISPVIAAKNNISNVSSRPPLPNRLVQKHTPNAVHAEKERRKSQARHQIIKEIVSNQLSVGACV